MLVLTSNNGGAGEQVALLTQQGDTLPVSLQPGSSLAGSTRLSTVLFVDGGSTATGTPNGSISNPFLTVQAAVDVAPAGATIYVCPKLTPYAEDVHIDTFTMSIIGLAVPDFDSEQFVSIQSIHPTTGFLGLQNLTVGLINDAGSGTSVNLVDVNVTGADDGITCGTLVASSSIGGGCTIAGPITVNGVVEIRDVAITGSGTSCTDFIYSGSTDPQSEQACSVSNVTATGNLSLQGANLTGNGYSADNFTLRGCNLAQTMSLSASGAEGAPATVYGTTKSDPASVITFVASLEGSRLVVDAFSNQWMNNTVLTVFEFVEVVGALPHVSISVAVPGVAAGAVGYATVSTTDTELAGITASDVVVANPTAQLHAAGTGGAYVNCRVSALETIELAFLGPLAGGNLNFLFSRLTRAATPF